MEEEEERTWDVGTWGHGVEWDGGTPPRVASLPEAVGCLVVSVIEDRFTGGLVSLSGDGRSIHEVLQSESG